MKNLISNLSLLIFVILLLGSCSQNPNVNTKEANINPQAKEVKLKIGDQTSQGKIEKVEKSEEEWKKELTEEEFYILRKKGTERSFTGDLWDHKEEGIYTCAGCALPLFESSTKFKSGTGWPSYWQPIEENHIAEEVDNKHGWNRTEVLCARCDGHLGHVFDDGPKPTGLRYCINSASLDFVKKEKKD